MFIYCQNDPINASDPTGFVMRRDNDDCESGSGTDRVESEDPPNTNLSGALWGTAAGVVENTEKKVVGYLGKDSVMHLYPKTSIAQKIQPYAKLGKSAAKAFTAVTAALDVSHTWDPMVKLSTSQRCWKTAIQLAGVGAGIAVGAFLSGPLLAAGMASGGMVALAGGVIGAGAIDWAAATLVSIGQDAIYKKIGIE